MGFNLSDLIDIERTQQLLENFLSAVGIPAAIIDLKGTVLVSSRWQRVCTDFHRQNEVTRGRCIESDTILANDLLEGKTFSLYRCLNGLTDAASPIIIEGKHLANAFIGQFFIEKPDLEFFRGQAKEFGFDESAYWDALSEVPIVAKETLPSLLSVLTSFVVMTASLGLRQLRQIETNRQLEAEVRNREKVEEIVRARNQLLHAMAGAVSRQKYLDVVVSQIQGWSGCRCVGIRLLNESGAIPYESYTGFSKEFWELENGIILGRDSCVCTRVVTGKPEAPDSPHMTAKGSFRCQDTAAFAASLTESELSGYRGVCISSGFQSIAVIPIRHGARICGAIHLADTTPFMLPDRLIGLLEDSTLLIGEAIHKFHIRDRLRRSQQLLEKTFEGLDDSVLVIDAKDQTVLACNPALTRDFGYATEYVTGRNTEFLHVNRDAYVEFERRTIAALDTEGVFRTEFRMRRKDGSVFPTEHIVTDLVDDSGERIAVVGTIRDITSRKNSEAALVESERKFHAIFESALDTIVIADGHGKFKDVNPVASGLFGLEREELIGRSIRDFSVSEFDFDRAWGVFLKKGIAKGELRLSRADGTVRDVEYCAVSEFYPEHHLAVLRDITGRKQAEAELKSYAARLEQSNQALQEFAAIASHDMKEPLRKVTSFGNMLLQKYKESLDQTGNDYLNRMLDATGRLQSLLTGLLAYSRVTMTPEPFREVDLNDIVHKVLCDLEVGIVKTECEVHVGDLPVISADPTQMRQLFQNLIGNAMKFHEPGEKPIVRVRCESNTDSGFQIIVEDNGIGFEEQDLERIFAPFQRLHGKDSQYEGTGMGLAICKKIVERHGGSIKARGRPGQGATFIVTLPPLGD